MKLLSVFSTFGYFMTGEIFLFIKCQCRKIDKKSNLRGVLQDALAFFRKKSKK